MRDGRALPAVWLLAAVPVGLLGYLVFALSETPSNRRVGIALVVLAGMAIPLGALLAIRPSDGLVRGSLLVSLLWLGGAALAVFTMDFARDRLVVGGLPAAVALITATLALKRLLRRAPRPRRG